MKAIDYQYILWWQANNKEEGHMHSFLSID